MYVVFIYSDIQWGRDQAVIGFNAGDHIRSFTLPGSPCIGADRNLESSSNVGRSGTYVFRVDQDIITGEWTHYACPLQPKAFHF